MQWFRLYAEIVDDEKLRLLAFEDRWHFVAILACKAQGLFDATPDVLRLKRKLAVKLGLQSHDLDEALRRLVEGELIDADTLQPIHWDKRQFASDTSAERTRLWRERKKKECDEVERHGDVTVTDQIQIQIQNRKSFLPTAGVDASRIDAQRSPESSPETASTQGDDNVPSGVPRNPCPAERIVDLYHAKLPMARRVEQLTPTRRAALRARWHNELPTLDAFGNYFDDVAASRFLTGRVNGHGDRKPFVADFDWLLKPSNLVKVLEGKYHDG